MTAVNHECDEDAGCTGCLSCYRITGETVCQYTCEHKEGMDD